MRSHDIALRAVCESKLDRYLHDVINKGVCPMYDENDAFNDPLKWWKEICAKYPYVANIDCKYLAIPATSAPSEQVWSSLARILSLRHAHLSDDLVGHMIYVKENLLFLLKHYTFHWGAIGYSWLDGLLRNPWSGVQTSQVLGYSGLGVAEPLARGSNPLMPKCSSTVGVGAPHVQAGYTMT
jgi:hypothetical protein